MINKKILLLPLFLLVLSGCDAKPTSTASEAAKDDVYPKTKVVCKTVNNKEVCKTIKIRKKLDGTKVPEK